ncbi:hypothetical protein HMPREF1991_01285 [Hoylesella loescheii DSM 19665 = JCM 12249 = ATCC 15930]|uniref:Uncharacterized protein n=1 Tax=Hoylesella loescheii DSM 19665 = JCM 12249 = ATCC 15930 TaxID=1122985 RepID=A0A069QIJ5_HOYLO|nr:hypothetical protein HMPREF1991_01285 [Hoylesella loescheii DSM 19665 = JCM 12249 = ATCC 15930]
MIILCHGAVKGQHHGIFDSEQKQQNKANKARPTPATNKSL